MRQFAACAFSASSEVPPIDSRPMPCRPAATAPTGERELRTGIFLAPFHAVRENPTLAIDRDMELLEHLDRLNYHEAWVGEHHSGGFEIIACPEMFIAAAAMRIARQVGCPVALPRLKCSRRLIRCLI